MTNFILDSFSNSLLGTHLVFLIFFIMGMMELLVIYLLIRSRKKIFSKGYEAKAIVTDVVLARGSKGGTLYKPVFQFNTWLNQPVKVQSGIGSNPNYYPVGTEVEVFYDPDKPSQFVIKNDKRFRLVFIILGVMGTLFLLIGAGGVISLL